MYWTSEIMRLFGIVAHQLNSNGRENQLCSPCIFHDGGDRDFSFESFHVIAGLVPFSFPVLVTAAGDLSRSTFQHLDSRMSAASMMY